CALDHPSAQLNLAGWQVRGLLRSRSGQIFACCRVCGKLVLWLTRPPATKLVLDFLQRPATMASRQHSGTKLSTRRGKPARRRQHHLLRGRVPIWRDGSCVGCRACSAKNPPCFTPKLAPRLEVCEHQR